MIYLSNTTEAQAVFVPRDTELASGTLSFRATSTVDLDIVVDAVVVDLQMTRTYYAIAVSLPEGTIPGEYVYQLKAGDDVVSTGLLVIGEYGNGVAGQYDKPIHYEQYNG